MSRVRKGKEFTLPLSLEAQAKMLAENKRLRLLLYSWARTAELRRMVRGPRDSERERVLVCPKCLVPYKETRK